MLRKAGRLSDDDADDAAWAKLARHHARRDRGQPARHPRPARRPGDQRAPAAGRRLGHPRPPRHRRARSSPTRRRWSTSRTGVTSLWLEVEPDADFDTHARRRPARPGAGRAGRTRRPARRRRGLRRPTPATADLAEGTNLGADPLGARVRGLSTSSTDARPTWWSTVARWPGRPGRSPLVVDATAVHDLGASDAQELGYSMAVGAAYLRILTDAGHPARRRGRADRVPVRRHRRAVPDHRQAARGTPALGAGARAQRGRDPASSASTPSPAGR